MDNLDVTDSMYEKKYDNLQKRFYDKYDEMALTENMYAESRNDDCKYAQLATQEDFDRF